ncbi:Exportin-T-like protein [Dinothrombium tinctorium]|uniref:Exportin-T n=1 Tax=Dinothrombium tinctorium TaxID=1965070 RepID=A0A3S3PSD4_9ACAR|nr:Exportin-T-like protein [Dinothrombium tinctorium]
MNVNLISNYLTSADTSLQKEALNYFEQLKTDPNGWRFSVETLLNSNHQLNESAIFFCLHVVENYVKFRYETDEECNRALLRQFVFSWFTSNQCNSVYILNKFAYIVNTLFLLDFPTQRWNTFFHDFLALCQSQRHCDLFLRILIQINSDVADREIPRSQKDNERSNLIKDKMRETCLMELAQFWFSVINNYRESAPSLVCLCLNVIGSYVAWIDINLVTNECVMTDLFNLFNKIEYRCAVCDCFSGILHKGMDPHSKVTLIEQFMAVDVVKEKFNIANIMKDDNDQLHKEFLVKLAKLFNTIGLELIECYKKVKPKNNNNVSSDILQLLTYINETIENKFDTMCQFLSHKVFVISLQLHSFTREYIQWLKYTSGDKMCIEDAKTQEFVIILLKIIIEKSKIPSNYDFDEEESEFEECRKSCKTLFENLMCLNSITCFNFLSNNILEPVFRNWKLGTYTFEDIEVALYFLYLLGENMNIMPDQKRCENLLQLMITSNVSTNPFPAIQFIYFDIVLRYEKQFSHSLNFLIQHILISFLDERGFKNSSLKVRSRVCQVFNKFVKSHIKSKSSDKLFSFSEDILKRLQNFLQLNATEYSENTLMNGNVKKPTNIFDEVHYYIKEEDQLLIFETITAIIVYNHNYDLTKKVVVLRNLIFQPVWSKFNECYAKASELLAANANNENCSLEMKSFCQKMSHCISLIARTSKAFSNVQTMKSINAQAIYLQSFDIFIKCLELKVNEEFLFMMQSAIRQLLHRLIVCLDESDILPLLPVAIENLFLQRCSFNLKNIQELVPLINQIVTKFKHSWMFQRDLLPFLKQMFSPFVSSIFSLTADASLGNDERQALHKSYYSFLTILASNNVMDVFTSLDAAVIEKVLMTLVQGAVEFPDVGTQKACFLVLRKIIELEGSSHQQPNGENGIRTNGNSQAFIEFIYKTIVPACFYAQLRQQDENQMTNECINCLKTIQNTRGSEEFCTYIQFQFFPQHFPTFSRISDFMQALISDNNKLLKNSFKTFIQEFKKNEFI